MGAKIYTTKIIGLNSKLISISVSIERGLPSFTIIGVPASFAKKARDITLSQLKRKKIAIPQGKIKVQIEECKNALYLGGLLLPICWGVYQATVERAGGQLDDRGNMALYGEVDILGNINLANGWYQYLECCNEHSELLRKVVLGGGGSFDTPTCSLGQSTLRISHFDQLISGQYLEKLAVQGCEQKKDYGEIDKAFSSIVGQTQVKRALSLAISGFHDIYIKGSIGIGKSELAKAAAQYHNSQLIDVKSTTYCKYKSAFGDYYTDGVISPSTKNTDVIDIFAHTHRHVVIVEELPDISTTIKQLIKCVIEGGEIKYKGIMIKSRPLFIFTGNLCFCGKSGLSHTNCSCTVSEKRRFAKLVPNQLLNRISIHVVATDSDQLNSEPDMVRYGDSIRAAIEMQAKRYNNSPVIKNGELAINDILREIDYTEEQDEFLLNAINKLSLSRRDFSLVKKISRTIADYQSVNTISKKDIVEALSYRPREN